MCGWLRAATARASRSKRWRRSGLAASLLGEHLDRDEAIEPGVARLIHLAHSPGADQPQDFVGAETDARREGHG